MTCKPSTTAKLPILDSVPHNEGRRFWRSLEELADSTAVEQWLAREFPSGASIWNDSLSRRKFLTLMGASLALAGVSGCSVEPAPEEDIVPYVHPPEFIVPGRPLFFATTMHVGLDAVGVLVESHMGRPTKVEGNPSHPASLGATSVFHQASVLGLYDPDRSQAVTFQGQERTWADAAREIRKATAGQLEQKGRGLRILTPAVVSPTLSAQIGRCLARYEQARWCVFDPVPRRSAYQGAKLAFDADVMPVYDLSQADVILSLDCDLIGSGPGHLRYARQFAERRRIRNSQQDISAAEMNRLYVVETMVSCTGAKADHRLASRASEVRDIAERLNSQLFESAAESAMESALAPQSKWIAAVADDLLAHRGRSLVVAGERQPAAVHLLVHAINQRLGNIGTTVRYIKPVEMRAPEQEADYGLAELTSEMQNGDVECLLILGGNPAYAAPADIPFAQAMKKVPQAFHLSLYQDETSKLAHWHLPESHFLEHWSDARAFDGTASLVQPLIKPLYQGHSAHELMALVNESQFVRGQDLVKQFWRETWGADLADSEFQRRWQTSLHDGFIEGSAFESIAVTLADKWQERLAEHDKNSGAPASESHLEVNFEPDPTLYDGRFANNGWLQELPKPITLLTWGNAAIVSPTTAQRLGLKPGTYVHGGQHGGHYMPSVELKLGDRRVSGPLWIMPGHADDCVTVYLGHGRRNAGRVGTDVGFDVYRLRSNDAPWFAAGLELKDLGTTEIVACTQVHHSMEGRDLVRSGSISEYQENPHFATQKAHRDEHDKTPRAHEPLTFYESFDYEPPKHKWGMAIDLTSCMGCNACIIACQAENNIPVVGKEQVAFGREMHWLRVDRYLEGPPESPTAFHLQPLPCMHCENAPCEYVCPVEATVHSAEGLNDMIYNRCVGTRFCSNNCPYKVRRFNFLAYADFDFGTERLQFNPDVTVRSRGVMEKCTYCVQRIRQADIDAQTEQRPIRDGEILTACQAVCPTQAIVFGDMNDTASEVHRWKDSPLSYGLLEELNTFPRTTYLAELRNPNPALEGSS